MISRAINMLRSLGRTSETSTEGDRQSYDARMNMMDTSHENTVIVNDLDNREKVSKLRGPILQDCNKIQPRASIRMKDSTNLHDKPGEGLRNYSHQENGDNDITADNEEDEIVILDSIPPRSKVNNVEKELLHIDDEYLGNLIMDVDDTIYNKEEEQSDSQSSHHTSPKEVFDLCQPSIKAYKVKKESKEPVETKKKVSSSRPVEKSTPKKIVTRQRLRSNALSQSELKDNCLSCATNEDQSGDYCDKKKKDNSRDKGKDVIDEVLRVRLPIRGTKKRKLFVLRISDVISMLNHKTHPLHKWQDLITLENMYALSHSDRKKMIKILVECLDVRVVQIKC